MPRSAQKGLNAHDYTIRDQYVNRIKRFLAAESACTVSSIVEISTKPTFSVDLRDQKIRMYELLHQRIEGNLNDALEKNFQLEREIKLLVSSKDDLSQKLSEQDSVIEELKRLLAAQDSNMEF